MRKLLNIIGLSMLLLAASCNMDKKPVGYTDQKEAFENVIGIENLEKGAYARLRTNYTPNNMIVADIQADYVNALYGFSNTFGAAYKWTFMQDDAEITSVWNNCYLTIAQCNFILDNIQYKIFDTPEENVRLNAVRGRLLLMRAMSYSILAERFCADYDEGTAKRSLGLPLTLSYLPDEKPERASLFDVYDRIIKDLNTAADEFKKVTTANGATDSQIKSLKGVSDATYLNADCIEALKAHVYLQMDLYPEAYQAAANLIKSPAYAMAMSLDEFNNVWEYDTGKEIIFKFPASKTEVPASYGGMFYSEYFGHTRYESEGLLVWSVDFIPTKDLINSIEPADYRKSWFFVGPALSAKQEFCWTFSGKYVNEGYTMIKKFPGNPNLRTDNSWNFANTWKVFRLAEMYLIAAEAAVKGASGDVGDAKTLLNTLRQHRGLTALDNVTIAEVKTERYKEMMLEGTRLVDLKRWGDDMQRGKAQTGTISKANADNQLVPEVTGDLSIPLARDFKATAGDFRFVWPIPFSEIYANQNLAGQQNPGWNKN